MERTSPSQSDQIDHDYEFSIKKIHPDYRMQYRLLCGYSFIWWGFYSFFVIFQPLYLVHAINLPLWAVFINGAVESIFTIFIQSKWSDAADKTGNLRRYMFIGNLFMAFVALFMLLVQNLFMLFVLSFLYRASPNSDVFATTYIYQISDYIPPESEGTEQDGGSNSRQVYTDSDSRGRPVVLSASQKKYNQINTFAHYRRFGSIGWAIFAPFGGWLCNLFGFIPVFMVCALGFALLSIAILYAVDEGPNFNRNKNQIDRAVRRNLDNLEDYEIKTAEKKESDQELPQNSRQESTQRALERTGEKAIGSTESQEETSLLADSLNNPENMAEDQSGQVSEEGKAKESELSDSYLTNIKKLLTHRLFLAVIVSSLLFSIAQSITYRTQGIFYGLLTDNNYVLIALAYSISAFIEWPVMTLIAKHLGDYSWTKMVAITYVMSAVRQMSISFIAFYGGGIYWVYILQIFRGVIFGTYLPTITFGIYSSMTKSPNLALSFHRSVKIVGSLLGNLVGALLSWVILEEISIFIAIFVMAFVISGISAFVLYKMGNKANNEG